MPTIADYLRALNAPPSMGELSAATTQPWLVPGAGTGPGAQLIMKDPAGVAAAAEAQASAAGPVNRYAGLIWGDSPGQAQGNLLNRRAQDLNAAAQAAARAQQAQQFNIQQQRLQDASREAAAWRQAEVAQRTRNDTLDFLSALAKLDTETGTTRYSTDMARATTAKESNEQRASMLTDLNSRLEEARGALAIYEPRREQAKRLISISEKGPEYLQSGGVLEVPGGLTPVVPGGRPDWSTINREAQEAYDLADSGVAWTKQDIANIRTQYNQVPRERIVPTVRPPAGGLSAETLAALLAAAGISSGTVRRTPTVSQARPLLVPGWNGSAASDPRYRRVKVDFNAPGVYGPQTVEETMGFTPQGPVDYPSYDRQFGVTDEAPVTRMQMLPDGSLIPQAVPTGGGGGIDPAFQQALDSSLNKQSLLAPLASELARRLSIDPERLGGSTAFSTPEAQVYDVIRSLTGGNPEIRARINALPPAVVNQLFRNAMIEARRNPARTVSRLGLNI